MHFLKQNFNKPQLVPLLFIMVATLTLTYLGVWQMKRLLWKNEILRQIEHAQSLPPMDTLPQSPDGLEYRKVAFSGIFKHDKALHMIGRQRGNFPGYFIVTPFELINDGRIILVNRGFSPAGKESKPEGVQTVEGIIRPARKKRFFAPENIPEKNVWFYEDMEAMSENTGLTLSPVIIEETGEKEGSKFPIVGDGKVHLHNNHLGYAITWFLTAIIGLIMFGFYYRKTEKNR